MLSVIEKNINSFRLDLLQTTLNDQTTTWHGKHRQPGHFPLNDQHPSAYVRRRLSLLPYTAHGQVDDVDTFFVKPTFTL